MLHQESYNPFPNVSPLDIAVEVSEQACGDQYRVGTVMLCHPLPLDTKGQTSLHYLFQLEGGVAIIREYLNENSNFISLLGVENREILQLSKDKIQKIYLIKGLYYRSDM